MVIRTIQDEFAKLDENKFLFEDWVPVDTVWEKCLRGNYGVPKDEKGVYFLAYFPHEERSFSVRDPNIIYVGSTIKCLIGRLMNGQHHVLKKCESILGNLDNIYFAYLPTFQNGIKKAHIRMLEEAYIESLKPPLNNTYILKENDIELRSCFDKIKREDVNSQNI